MHSRHNFHQTLIAASRFFAATQDNRVPGFQRQDGRIHGNVRTRFINDSDHAKRHADFADAQAIRPRPLFQGCADRIVERGHIANPLRHLFHAVRRQQQTIAHGSFEAGACHVFAVRRKNRLGLGFDCIPDCQQQSILLVRRKLRQFGRSLACTQQFFLRGSRVGNCRRHLLDLLSPSLAQEGNTFRPCVAWRA